ncbi:kinase [Solibacillus sp. CAU 1738]|uniref:kinase n=1 Tax=Solibacillus sp. CAU 1738 TaxID=3140363 RepID=UPI0032606237
MSIDDVRNELIFQYNDRLDKKRPLIVAIDGLGGAGKTTLVKEIEHELCRTHNVSIIHIDDHIVENSKRYNTDNEEWYEYYFLQWNVELIVEALFAKLRSNCTEILFPFYDKTNDKTFVKKIAIQTDSIIIIEGVFLQREEWNSFYDYVIFIDCPKVIRHERILKRDLYIGDSDAIVKKYKTRYWPAEDYYMKKVQPIKRANIVINTNM